MPHSPAQGNSPALDRHLAAAKQAQARQDCHTAAQEYMAAADLLPASGELRSNEGVALYCDGQLPLAVATFKQSLHLNPRLAAPHLFLGLASFRLSDYTAATHELERFLQLSPRDPTAHLWLGYAYHAEHQYPAAVTQFEAVTAEDPGNMDAQYALGQSFLELGRAKARELETLAPQSPLLLHLAGEQYRLLGEDEKARAAFAHEQTVAGSDHAAPTGQEESLYHEAADAETRAQAAFHVILQQAPDSFRAHQILGDAFVLMQQPDNAIAEYEIVLRLNPTLPGVHEALSNCLMQGGRFGDALVHLQAEQRLQPNSAKVLMELGRVQLALGETADAERSLRASLAHADAPPDTYLLLARVSLASRNPKEAADLLQHYVALNPNSSAAFYLLSRAFLALDQRGAGAQALASYTRLSQQERKQSRQAQLTAPLTRDQGVLDPVTETPASPVLGEKTPKFP